MGSSKNKLPRERSLACVLNKNAWHDPDLNSAIELLQGDGHRIEPFSLDDVDRAVRSGCDVVVAAGGDGTLNRVVSAILQSGHDSIASAVLPYGTGNDFATACRIPQNDPRDGLLAILKGRPRRIDVGKVNEEVFVNVVSAGFGAEVSAGTSAELKAILGRLAYTLTGIAHAFQATDRQATLRAPDYQWEGKLLYLSVANGRLAGGGYHVAPDAFLNDGLLDVLIVPEADILEAPQVLIELFGFGNTDTEYVQYISTPWLEVQAPHGIHLTIDGEAQHTDTLRIEVLKRRLPFILPRRAPLL